VVENEELDKTINSLSEWYVPFNTGKCHILYLADRKAMRVHEFQTRGPIIGWGITNVED
jgi:hypothetical protein